LEGVGDDAVSFIFFGSSLVRKFGVETEVENSFGGEGFIRED
jgi:hypothetical protein